MRRLLKVIWPWKSRPETRRRAAGRAGEHAAARFLRRHGYKILKRNFRPQQGGEIDIVCRKGRTLVFCEVKSRRSEQFGRPFEAVDREKTELMWRGARQWLRRLGNPNIRFRFDIIEVLQDDNLRPREIRHLPDEGDPRDRFSYSPQKPDPTEKRNRRRR